MIILPSSKGTISKKKLLSEVAIGYTPTWVFRPEGAKDINGNLITANNTNINSIISNGGSVESLSFIDGSVPPIYEKKISWAKGRPAIKMIGDQGSGGKLFLTSNVDMTVLSTRNKAVMFQVCIGLSSAPNSAVELLRYDAITASSSLGNFSVMANSTNLYISNPYGTFTFVSNYLLNTPYTLCVYRYSYSTFACRVYNNNIQSNTAFRIGYIGNYQPTFIAFNNVHPFYLFEIIGYAQNGTTTLGTTQPILGYNYFQTKYGLGN